jgi:hypothetical protein
MLVVLAGIGTTPLVAAGNVKVQLVSFTEYACPPGISTPAQLDAAGGADAVCAVAGKVGEFSWLPAGYSWQITPIEFDLQAALKPRGRKLTSSEPTAGGYCNPTTLQCHAFQAYGWFNVPTGPATLTELTVPPGYLFGWATVSANGIPRDSTYDVSSRSVTFTTTSTDEFADVHVRFINLSP